MPRYFDGTLSGINADKIKPMVKIWGGSYKMTKYDCIDFIVAALKDPTRVQAAVASLEPWERSALSILKRMGGVIQHSTLEIGIYASGLHPRRTNSYRDDFVAHLLRRGLILAINTYDFEYITNHYVGGTLFSDERILAQVGFPEYQQIEIQPMSASSETLYRRSSAVSLDIMGMMHAIENMGGLKLTQNGTVRVNDEAKLRKAMHWAEKGIELDGFFFPNPVHAWLSAFGYSDLLKKGDDGRLVLKESPEQFVQRPFGEQARLLVEGLIRTKVWWEAPMKDSLDSDGKGRQQGRLALTLALSALPLNPDAFFSLDDFEQVLFNRIGQDFSFSYIPSQPYFLNKSTQEQQNIIADRKEKIRNNWLKQERPWLKGAFTTWLYFLGLVELAMENGQPVGFRLTDIGRAAFHPELASLSPSESSQQTSFDPVWVVQPNFDIIAYLEHTNASQLAFLERHAERTQSHQHTAYYRLTRESIYRGLQSGSTLADIIDRLQAGSQADLPQNVLVELSEWASLRERLILHRSSRLLEYPSAKALQAGLAQGVTGRVVVERFLVLDEQSVPHISAQTIIDYAGPPLKNLSVTEMGTIHLKPGSHDLLTPAQLSQWAIQLSETEWQLTSASVSQALQSGQKINDFLSFLQNRLSHSLPQLLNIALRSWAGEPFSAELKSVIILRCPRDEIFKALIHSPMIIPTLRGFIRPDLIFVKAQGLDSLRQQLNWLGWKISEQLQVISIK